MARLSQRRYAQRVGVSPVSITRLVRAGSGSGRPLRRLVILGGALLGAATMAKFFGIFLLIPLGLAWFFSRANSHALCFEGTIASPAKDNS